MESKGFTVQVKGSGETFWCKPDEFVLTAMLRERCGPVTYGCCGGGCGICKMKIANGEYAIVKRMSSAHISQEEREKGIVLLCCIQPRSNLVLERA